MGHAPTDPRTHSSCQRAACHDVQTVRPYPIAIPDCASREFPACNDLRVMTVAPCAPSELLNLREDRVNNL